MNSKIHASQRTDFRRPLQTALFATVVLAGILTPSMCHGALEEASATPTPEQIRTKRKIPFELHNGALVVVRGTIGSIKNLNLIVDTGSNPSTINEKIANRLKLSQTAESLETFHGTIPSRTAVVSRIQVGELHVESARVYVQDLQPLEKSLGISLGGVAGMDILSTANCFAIDYRKRKIVFGPIHKSEKTVRFETTTPSLTIRAKIGDQDLRLVLDSGTPGLLLFRDRLRTPQGHREDISDTSVISLGGNTRAPRIRTAVSLGNSQFGMRDVAVANFDSDPRYDFDGILGFTMLGFRKVSFDFEHGLFGWE
jgi:hypothetical protein